MSCQKVLTAISNRTNIASKSVHAGWAWRKSATFHIVTCLQTQKPFHLFKATSQISYVSQLSSHYSVRLREGVPAVHNQNQWTISEQKSPSAVFLLNVWQTNRCTSCRVLLLTGGCKRCTVLLQLCFISHYLLTTSDVLPDEDQTPC